MYPVILFLFALVYATLHIYRNWQSINPEGILRAYLLSIIFFNIGCIGFLSFFEHAFMPDTIASKIGWPPGNPFQFEVAVANLAFGVLGLLSPLSRPSFWIAVVTGSTIFLFGAAWGHFIQWLQGDVSPYNTGISVWAGDLGIPLITATLMLTYYFCFMRSSLSR